MTVLLSYIAPVIFGIVGVLGLIGALMGLSRGISRQVIRTLTVIISAVISFFIAVGTYNGLVGFLDGKTMGELVTYIAETGMFGTAEDLAWLNNIDMETVELVMSLPMALVIMPLIFVFSFIPISGIMLLIYVILCALFGLSKKKNNPVTRILGLVLGLLQGIVVAGLLLMPIIGISTTVKDTVTVLNEEAPEDDTTVMLTETYNEYIKYVSENAVIDLYGKFGVNALYHGIATVDLAGESFDTTTLIPDVALIVGAGADLKGCDFKNLTPENEASINSILTVMDGDSYLKKVCAGAIKTFANFFEANENAALNLEPPIDSIMITAMEILKTTDDTTVMADFATIKDVYFILSKDGVLIAFDKGSDELLKTLTKIDENGTTTVNKIITTINANERTKPLTTLITQISISVISQQIGLDSNVIDTYNNVISDINTDIISIDKNSFVSPEEYVAAVSTSLDNTLQKNNINLEPEIVDTMAEYISNNYSEVSEITPEEANDIILSYYDAYLKHQAGGQ